ncbi:LysR substrate-binding domain-containing protein [Aurantimonas sp. C2-6-R+9]|uniref:LysR substrate-binding domain-containing protein n=1 Tax=unclassified Aurantimonas TaxID=2638230 RepID=UPI002E1902FB|nr:MULTISPECIES: LysR substrate-binding domain-containing protein [unclassified Aurantimonas]MEC5292476.1 LysR substrate-binding domain-containing protein [Aurantimonas sp. C2-3-R2]MEC5382699.1 LysR substrate-binding domain-containing protein [Aurantimonas sp. C2-6-R+9]MEC5413508.1 LysR substrate-binding domain-containing protein [Aurantimonas sp. C2-4-R8]
MHLPIRAINVFHAAARSNSITRAAEELGVTPSAVSQQIRLLETQLGTSLMLKEGRHVKLTEAGERYFASITEEIERIAEATNQIRGYKAVRILTIRATPSLATKWLMPRLTKFIAAHPEVDIRLDGTNEPTDFSRESVDIEIRHGEGRWPELHVEPFAEERFYAVCAPGYVSSGRVDPETITDYRLIHSVKSQMQWSRWFSEFGVTPKEGWRRIFFDRSHMAVDAAVAGIGIALESDLMMQRELVEGLLVSPIAEPPILAAVTQWLVCPDHHLRRRQVQAFLAWVKAERDAWAREATKPAIH